MSDENSKDPKGSNDGRADEWKSDPELKSETRCQICGKEYKSEAELMDHSREEHAA